MTCCTIECIGWASLLFVVGWFVRAIWQTYIYSCDYAPFLKGGNKWAIVTGATNGIGAGFADEAARLGFNVLLVSRSEDKLKAKAAEIQAEFKVQTRYVVSNAISTSFDEITRVVNAAAPLSVRLLVNNVGLAQETPGPFEETAKQDIDDMVLCNCLYSTRLTQALIPLLRKKAADEKSGIINLASVVAWAHMPYLAVYSATKAYNLAFSHSLEAELRSQNFEVLAVCPGFVISNMSKMTKESLTVCNGNTCARQSLRHLGLRDHAGYSVHHWFLNFMMTVPAQLRNTLIMADIKKLIAKQNKKNAEKSS